MDNIIELWKAVLQELASSVSNAVFSTWIKDLVPVDFDGDCVTVQASSDFKKNIINNKFLNDIKNACEKVIGFPINVTLTAAETAINKPKLNVAENQNDNSKGNNT